VHGRERAQQLEAAKMRSEQEASSPLVSVRRRSSNPLISMSKRPNRPSTKYTRSRTVAAKVNQCRQRSVRRGGRPERAQGTGATCSARAARMREVGANRIQQQTGDAPPAAQSEPLHESCRAAAARSCSSSQGEFAGAFICARSGAARACPRGPRFGPRRRRDGAHDARSARAGRRTRRRTARPPECSRSRS